MTGGGEGQRLAEIRARVEKATPGPWRWEETTYATDPDTDPFGNVYSPELISDGRWVVTATTRTIVPQSPFGPHDVREPFPFPTLMTTSDDRDFIAHSRDDVPYLLDLVDALSSQVARVEGHLRCIPFETDEVEAAIRQHERAECEGACMTAAAGREVLRLRQPQSVEGVEP